MPTWFPYDLVRAIGPKSKLIGILKAIEAEAIKRAPFITNGRQKRAAKLLGMTFRQIRYRIDKYNIRIRRK